MLGWPPNCGATIPKRAGGEHRCGKGRVIWGKTAREVLLADGIPPDFEFAGGDAETLLDYIHRRDGDAEIYFVANRGSRWEEANCTFRVSGKVPELFDPLTGQTRSLAAYSQAAGRTAVPLQFAPFGSWFVDVSQGRRRAGVGRRQQLSGF